MKCIPLCLCLAFSLSMAAAAQAVTPPEGPRPERSVDLRLGQPANDLPARPPGSYAWNDTLDFGYFTIIGGETYAALGEKWTWDHGAADVFEGWVAVDETENPADYFRRVSALTWAGHNNEVAAPILEGEASVWCGIFEDQADSLCWSSGLGYGNNWCQRFTSPEFTWMGQGNVNLEFRYFNHSEPNFDYSTVILQVGQQRLHLNDPGFTGVIGTPPSGPWADYTRIITAADFGVPGPTTFRIAFEFASDGGWSDEDGEYPTPYGPFGFDNLRVLGDVDQGPYNYDFESDLEGWTSGRCPGIGSFFSIQPVSQYVILDPCRCPLSGNVAAFHDANLMHPVGQLVSAFSPPADRTSLQTYNTVLADWDQYTELPQNNGVFYRPAWTYYPYLCPASGSTTWSPVRGQVVWQYTGDAPSCYSTRNIATDWGIPPDCELVRFVYQVWSSCDAFGIPPTLCTGVTNFTPVIDNVRIRMTQTPDAPVVHFEPGCQFQDGFPMSPNSGLSSPGNADICEPVSVVPNPEGFWRLGDSLVVAGPMPTASKRWEAKLWFRVKREGPFQIHLAAYRGWLDKVRDGRQIVGPRGQFTWGWMDSVEVGTGVSKNKFDSYFREDDDDYTPGPSPKPDINALNEIIRDGILVPGSKIEYFVTANYTCHPTTYSYCPDTSGGNYWEFEILPSYRTDDQTGYYKTPCILYVDAFDRGVQPWLEGAFNILLNGHSPTGAMRDIPDPTKWDRYDYLNAASSFHAPMVRGSGSSTNGATVAQLMMYRLIALNTGDFGAGAMDEADWRGLDQWLTNSVCLGNVYRQGFWASGDDIAGIMEYAGPSFLTDRLGATLRCDHYAGPDCPPGDPDNDEDNCVGLETVGGAWTPAANLDLWGNWCPAMRAFDVLGTTSTGSGQKSFRKRTPNYGRTDFAQVVNDQVNGSYRYRSVLDGYSLSQLVIPLGGDPATECSYDTLRILGALTTELDPMLKWLLNLAPDYDLSQYNANCPDPCLDAPGVDQDPTPNTVGLVNRLERPAPNPFNRSAVIRFSLAQTGPTRLLVFDANGRRIRTLADGPLTAGPHSIIWDGLDETGHKVPSGIYWSRLSAAGFTSNMRMVVMR